MVMIEARDGTILGQRSDGITAGGSRRARAYASPSVNADASSSWLVRFEDDWHGVEDDDAWNPFGDGDRSSQLR